jgi:Na+-transporting methylmalonyl-CoA/oxaloacetate decarboxylase gamma subunit
MIHPMLLGPSLMLITSDELAARETEALLLALVGMSVVFLALVTIGVFIYLLGRVFVNRPSAAPAAAMSAAPLGAGQLDARTIAVISAAAFAAVGRPVRVQRITFINRNTISAWAERGRVSIHGSHNVRRTL